MLATHLTISDCAAEVVRALKGLLKRPNQFTGLRHHLTLWRNLLNIAKEKGPLQVSKYTPPMAAYWTSEKIPHNRALLTHGTKTMFGFDELATSVDEEA
ncbi:hypothetical protein [Bythopirellula goksoeyrii]|uniref:Uncharacterized protein n=1 Tax=Bythopirellula goksoeyrii TaxID=1400387 RepID=A0A5B9QDV6_9BACT|nr:hypothetical protein [Bythopirellula goksoeyrii]QEG35989.1 hypothetical protein Pr1d_32980 [Bythopirellula goksoeyrii]